MCIKILNPKSAYGRERETILGLSMMRVASYSNANVAVRLLFPAIRVLSRSESPVCDGANKSELLLVASRDRVWPFLVRVHLFLASVACTVIVCVSHPSGTPRTHPTFFTCVEN